MIKLDAMENPYRLPAELQAELASVVQGAEINRYPDPLAPALKARLRSVMDIPAGFDLLLGNGSDEIIQMMIQACGRPGACIMAPSPTFSMYRQYALIAGLSYVGVPLEEDFSLDPGRFRSAMQEHRPAVIFISYPNNPTGNLFPEKDLEAIVSAAPGLVVVDEAYQPFAESTFMGRLPDFPNLVLLRTVSKLGLAGLRLGYAVARPDWIREFDKVRSPYNVNTLTQLVAEKVLAYKEVFTRQAMAICVERSRLIMALRALRGVRAYPSQANFVLARMPDAASVFGKLKQRQILVKSLDGMHPLLDQCLRLTVGTPDENNALIAALQAIEKEQGVALPRPIV
jgi:histidinol-phosphate aminotransferase